MPADVEESGARHLGEGGVGRVAQRLVAAADGAACRSELQALGIRFRELPDRTEPDAQGGYLVTRIRRVSSVTGPAVSTGVALPAARRRSARTRATVQVLGFVGILAREVFREFGR